MFNFKLKNLLYLTLISIINFIYFSKVQASAEDENYKEQEKLTRLNSCVKLINIMIKEDKDYLDYVFKTFFTSPKAAQKKSYDSIFVSIKENILQICYSEISIIKSAELMNLNVRAINPFTKENKKLISPEEFKAKYSGVVLGEEESERKKDTPYAKDFKKMNSVIELGSEIEELNILEEKIATFVDTMTYSSQKESAVHLSKSK